MLTMQTDKHKLEIMREAAHPTAGRLRYSRAIANPDYLRPEVQEEHDSARSIRVNARLLTVVPNGPAR